MKKVKLQCNQKGLIVQTRGKNSVKLRFEGVPLEVDSEIADLLVKQDSSNFTIVHDKPKGGKQP